MCISAGTALLASAILGTGAAVYTANKQEKAQEEAMRQQEEALRQQQEQQTAALQQQEAAMKQQKDIAEQQMKLQQEALKPSPGQQAAKSPEPFRRVNRREGLLGVGGTLLTGPGGVPPGLVNTGKTLLGS